MNKVTAKLAHVALFESLKNEPKALDHIAGEMEHRNVSKGNIIIKEGDEGDEMFILYRGEVEVCKNTLAKELYTVVKFSDEQHAFFGELALLDNDRRSATVIAKTDCELLVLKKDKFETLGDLNPEVGLAITRKISRILSQRLRRANQDMVTLYEALVGEIEEST